MNRERLDYWLINARTNCMGLVIKELIFLLTGDDFQSENNPTHVLLRGLKKYLEETWKSSAFLCSRLIISLIYHFYTETTWNLVLSSFT